MQTAKNTFFLQWKGKASGPFTVEEIKAKLDSNEIGLLYNVRDQAGTISTLEEFLEGQQKAEQRREQERRAQHEQARLQSEREERLAAAQNKHEELQRRLTEVEGKVPSAYPPMPPRESPNYQFTGNYAPRRTSGLAVTALVMGLCNFVPFVNFVTWILAIIFGHIALSQINRDPSLGGRGMAVAGLMITYILLGVGLVFGIFLAATNHF